MSYMTGLCVLTGLLLHGVTSQSTNLALGKPAGQTGTYDRQIADRAVDGWTSPPYCAHPDNPTREEAEWWVDLEDTYRVQRIVIVNTNNAGGYFRLTNFVLSVGPTLDTLSPCGPEYMDVVGAGAPVTINCDLVGRFVKFRRLGGTEVHLVTLCEVEVYGTTAYDCNLCLSSVSCTSSDGCSQCHPGKIPPACVRDCWSGTYGVNCSSNCGRCRSPSECGPENGECSGGCQLWFAGNKCDVNIVRPDRTTETARISDVTNSSLEITWQQITSVPRDYRQYYTYTISYRPDYDPSFTVGPTVVHMDSHEHSVWITVLEFYRKYYVRITPYREMDGQMESGAIYPIMSRHTACGYPDSPTGVRVMSFKENGRETIRVVWNDVLGDTIRSRCAGKSSVRVEYRLEGTTFWSQIKLALSATEYNIELPGGTYQVRVVLVNTEGLTTASDVQTITIRAPTLPTTEAPTTSPGADTTTASSDTTSSPGEKLASTVNQQTTNIVVPVVVVLVLAAVGAVLAVFFIRRRRQKETQSTVEDQNITEAGYANMSYEPSDGIKPTIAQTSKKPAILSSKPKQQPREPKDDSGHSRTPDKLPIGRHDDGGEPESGDEETVAAPSAPHPNASQFDTGPVAVADLQTVANNKMLDSEKFSKEYKSLPADNKSRCKLGQTDDNKNKNRFLNIFPYDDTLVELEPSEYNSSGYINANYISGYYQAKEYIATQGPKKDTVADLWQMMWEQNANRIIMVANLVDEGKRRCTQYWPDKVGTSVTWGDFDITMEAEDVCADYTQRTLTVEHEGQSRAVRQFHFTSWEDKNKPLHGAVTLFAFYRKVRSFDTMSRGPMIVHCSAGVGRTGTFIAFDILVNQAKEEGQVDIYGTVQRLRLERMTMVQTEKQYAFLHDALVEYLKTGNTSYPAANFSQTFREIGRSSEPDGSSKIEQQFNVLSSLKRRPKKVGLDGLKADNVKKNRTSDIIAEDMHRPYLTTPYKQGTNYINAVYTSSYRAHKHYVATQMPLPDTIVDFWRLVKDQECHTIIMLNGIHSGESCHPYWPDEDEPKQRYGPIEVQLVANNTDNKLKTIIARDFEIRRATTKGNSDQTEAMRVRQFQLLSWPADSELPPSRGDLLDLMDQVQNWQQKRRLKPSESRILVHCLDGASRCGMYCATSFVLDKLKVEQEVDAFLAVRYVTRTRPQFINSLTEYKFLYGMAMECMTRYDEYANFQ